MKLPKDFISRTEPLFGPDLWGAFTSALDSQPPTSIRLNPDKAKGMSLEPQLQDGEVPWCADGFYLKERPNFTFDPLLHGGLYYVQEASSMFISHVLRQHLPETPVKTLDLCASPGGKSTAARAILPAGSLLLCNEPVRTRAQILAENMMKQGSPDVIVTNNYAKDIARSGLKFDVVIADVPCSGEGMFRKDPGAVDEWSVGNVEKCWRLQREIITDVWPALRDGGLLVYSTCTFNTQENEENVRYIMETLGAEALSVDIKDGWMIRGSLLHGFKEPVYRFLPGQVRGEGLFMAVLRKLGNGNAKPIVSRSKTIGFRGQNNKFREAKQWVSETLCGSESYEALNQDGSIVAIPKAWMSDYMLASKSLNILSAGVHVGDTKGKDVVPAQSLALSTALRKDAYPTVELSHAEAVSYLRRELTALPTGTPHGFVLATYRGHPVGFMKNIGNRANNLYPAEWRIRSGHTPEGICEVMTVGN